jgi:hypothetical protein
LWTLEERLRPPDDVLRPHGRDPARELLWLLRAEGSVDASEVSAGFTRAALARLGHSVSDQVPAVSRLEPIIGQMERAAADLGAFGVLARQAVELDELPSDAEREFIATTLHLSMAFGAYAYHAIALTRRHLQGPEGKHD